MRLILSSVGESPWAIKCGLSNGTDSNHLEWPWTSRSFTHCKPF